MDYFDGYMSYMEMCDERDRELFGDEGEETGDFSQGFDKWDKGENAA